MRDGSGAQAADDDVMVGCANTPSHPGCGQTEHFKVEEPKAGEEAFAKMRGRLYDANDPVAQILAYSKWGNPTGFKDMITDAFFYPVDKANCVYAEAERVFYPEESGPIEEGTNENTARAVLFYLNNIGPKGLEIKSEGVFYNGERLFLGKSERDLDRIVKGWAQIYAQHCKGK